ncbi:hypothetical protein ACFRDV_03480 [Streptomyces fagopyri]|uniref:hypothetical protein n=1 Tax=Streptomyces fagopyri TaxID=2662397 RepID=UPI00368C527C
MDAPDNAPAETTGDRLEGAPTAPLGPLEPVEPVTAPVGPAVSPTAPAVPAASATSATAAASVPARSPLAWVVPPGLPPRPSHPGA